MIDSTILPYKQQFRNLMNIFGGYTEQSWSGNGNQSDQNAFIFSLINLDDQPLKMKCIDSKVQFFV